MHCLGHDAHGQRNIDAIHDIEYGRSELQLHDGQTLDNFKQMQGDVMANTGQEALAVQLTVGRQPCITALPEMGTKHLIGDDGIFTWNDLAIDHNDLEADTVVNHDADDDDTVEGPPDIRGHIAASSLGESAGRTTLHEEFPTRLVTSHDHSPVEFVPDVVSEISIDRNMKCDTEFFKQTHSISRRTLLL